MEHKSLKEIVNNAKSEAFDSLLYAHKLNMPIEYIREVSTVHTSLCMQYHLLVVDEIEQQKQELLNRYKGGRLV